MRAKTSWRAVQRGAVAAALVTALTAGTAAPAGALLGGVVDLVGGTVGSLTSVVTAGWDDNVTAPPAPMSVVADAVGADNLWAKGVDGSGVGVAVIDTGVVP